MELMDEDAGGGEERDAEALRRERGLFVHGTNNDNISSSICTEGRRAFPCRTITILRSVV